MRSDPIIMGSHRVGGGWVMSLSVMVKAIASVRSLQLNGCGVPPHRRPHGDLNRTNSALRRPQNATLCAPNSSQVTFMSTMQLLLHEARVYHDPKVVS